MKTHTIKTLKAELETLKNQYAQEQGYEDWDELANSVQDDLEYDQHWTEICIRAQKAALEKAAENANMKLHDGHFKTDSPTKHVQIGANNVQIDRTSITNPENLIR